MVILDPEKTRRIALRRHSPPPALRRDPKLLPLTENRHHMSRHKIKLYTN